MGPILTLALWRTASGRGLLLLLGAGILVTATLLAAGPIYSRAMADLGLTFTLRDELQGREWARVDARNLPLAGADAEARRGAIEQRIDQRLGWFTQSRVRATRLGRWAAYVPGAPERTGAPLGKPWSMPGYEARVRVVEGRLPGETPPGQPYEVAAGARAARLLGVRVGDTFELREGFDNCERTIPADIFPPPPPPCDSTATVAFTFTAKLVGIIEPQDAQEPYWLGAADSYFEPQNVLNDIGPTVPLAMSDAAVYGRFAAEYPGYLADAEYHVFANLSALDRSNYKRARADLDGLYAELEGYNVYATSPIKDALTSFAGRADYQQTPLTLLLLQISGIALFYVALVAAVVVERQAPEIALLRSRGATLFQVLVLYALQGFFIGVPLLVLAPFLAGALTAGLGYTPAFSNVAEGSLPVTLTPFSFVLAALGVVLSVGALLLPVVVVGLRGTLAQRRGEARPRASLFQRYYLDLVLAAIAILLLLELNQRGTVFEPSATGGISSDPLLLASPALAMAAAAALIVRFVPLLLRLAARAARTVAPPAAALGLWQLVRNSGQYTRLTLLLMMAVSVGTFAASYATTTQKSYEDRANYTAGVELRAYSSAGNGPPLGAAEIKQRLEALPGVARAVPVIRTIGAIGTPGVSAASFQVLGIEPTAGDLLWERPDFAAGGLARVLRNIAPPAPPGGKEIPGNPTSLSAWVRGDSLTQGVVVRAMVQDAKGFQLLVELGEMEGNGQWQQLTGSLVPRYFDPMTPPLQLLGLTFSEPLNRAPDRNLALDDITAAGPDGTAVVVEDFERPSSWSTFLDRTAINDTFTTGPESARSGKSGAKLVYRPQSTNSQLHGIYYNNFRTPIPVVVSRSFLAAAGLQEGGTTLLLAGGNTLLPIRIAGVFELLPTTVQGDGPVVVMDREALTSWAALSSGLSGREFEIAEAWLDLAPGADEEALKTALRAQPFEFNQVVSRADELRRAKDNPLIAAGGSGILSIAFVSVLGLVAAALITQLLTGVGRRRVEFAVARALGISRGQLLRMLSLEYGTVVVVGVVAGVAVGLFVSGQMLSFLEVSEAGDRVEPPFVLQTRWLVVAGAAGVVVAACTGALVKVAATMRRSADAQALRSE